jgi:hypothetical protein
MLLLPAAPATTTAISTAIALTPAAASTSATGTFRLGPCFVYIQRASLQLLLIHAIDGGLCLGIRWHFDESEAARLATELVCQNGYFAYLTERTECDVQFFFCDIARQISYENM